jgi:hypothetical protein
MATITELLLKKGNAEDFTELKTSVFKSRRLGEKLGLKEPAEVVFREIPQRRGTEILHRQLNKKGDLDLSKSFDVELFLIIDSVVEPDLRNKDLQSMFKASNPKELAELLFGNEVKALSEAILDVSGLSDDAEKDEDLVKN